jgi:hypothetical protein
LNPSTLMAKLLNQALLARAVDYTAGVRKLVQPKSWQKQTRRG